MTAPGGGLTNSVWQVRVAQGDYVVRTHDHPGKVQDYLKEQWAMDAARAAGVPTPRVLEVGNAHDGRPYMILEHVAGVRGEEAPQRSSALRALGNAAATLHTVKTRGFGSVFDWSGNRLSRETTWSGWLMSTFDVEHRLGVLRKHRMLGERGLRRLRQTAREMSRRRMRPVLQHGDLRLKNAIVDPESGALRAIVDWEMCASLPPPSWELSTALHDLGIDEKETFLAGYGIGARAFADALPGLRFFNVMNYCAAIEAAVTQRDSELL
ncbi:MAG: aminoglycoside phosphotransferase family protein, partial [Rhizobacter sp.]|nr:aminoglycoside phosphotransferase family protein [Rhizobacter sp.]